MTGFNLDFNDTFEGYEDVQDGVYEVVIESVVEDANANTGTEFTNFTMVIRNDLDQPHKNSKVWERIWKAKATGKYNMMMFNTIGKAAQLENGKSYSSFEELLADYEGKPVQVLLKNETSEYNGKTYENLNVKKWTPTKFPNVQHQFKGKKSSGGETKPFDGVTIDDNALPF